MMSRDANLIVALDIGTTKVCAIVAEIKSPEEVNVLGVGTHPSGGLKKGVVVNIDKTVESIKSAIDQAEEMSGCEIRDVYVGVAGGHVQGMSGHGMITLRSKEVAPTDVDRAIESASAVMIPSDREVLHVIPQEFIVDGQPGIKDPVGIYGMKLETKVHIVTGQITAAQNLVKCVHNAGMDVSDMVLEQIASSEAVLSSDEKEIGVVLVDCGGGTCDVAIFYGGTIRYTENITLGGDHVDRDISLGLSTPLSEARKIKESYGSAYSELVPSDEIIQIESVGGRPPRKILRKDLAMIIEPRIEEIFSMVRKAIYRSGYKDLIPAGAVITGGTINIDGSREIAEKVLGIPVRIGQPNSLGGLSDHTSNPLYATGIGLVLYGVKSGGEKMIKIKEENVMKKVLEGMKNWFAEFF
jgi:cell division protein FtsA